MAARLRHNLFYAPSRLKLQFGLSLILHGVLIFGGSLWVPRAQIMSIPDVSVPVEVISLDQFTQLNKSPEVISEPEVSAEVIEKPEVVPESEAVFESASIPQPQSIPQPPSIPTPEKTVVPEIIDSAPPAPIPPLVRDEKPTLDIDQLRAILNKIPDAPEQTVRLASKDILSSTALSHRLTLSEVDNFRIQIRRCWNVPAGVPRAEQLVVVVRVQLGLDGRVTGGPRVVNRAGLGNRYFRIAAERVLRAIRQCQPYEMPSKKYELWRDLEVEFNPSDMFSAIDTRG